MSTYDDIMPDKRSHSSLLLIPDYGSIVSGNSGVLQNNSVTKNMGKQRQIIASFAGKKLFSILINSKYLLGYVLPFCQHPNKYSVLLIVSGL